MHIGNNKIFKNPLLFFVLSVFWLSCCSVSKTDDKKMFEADENYFLGLQLLEQNNEKEARAKLSLCANKGSYYCARKSAEKLTAFGDIQEKNKAAISLVKKYKDSDSYVIAARQLSESGEIHKLIELTNDCDIETEYNETIKLRLEAKKNRGDKSYTDEYYTWFTIRPITEFHNSFYQDTLHLPDYYFLEIENPNSYLSLFSPRDFVIYYRTKLYKRDYLYCYNHIDLLLSYFDSGDISVVPQLASDMGKGALYGSQNYYANAEKFHSLALKYAGTPAEQYFWFYAGRLYSKTSSQDKSKYCFENAITKATDAERKDNSIWYLMDTSLQYNLDSGIEATKAYIKQIDDPSYFDDFFEKLVCALVAEGKWDLLHEIAVTVDGYASDEVTAQFSYIYARLLQEGFASPYDNKTTEQCIKESFQRAINARTANYYKILAAYQLNYNAQEIENLLCFAPNKMDMDSEVQLNLAAEQLLKGYAYFGFPELIYPAFMDLYKDGISTDTSIMLADFLLNCADLDNDYYTQSLRIAARSLNYGDRPFTKIELKYLYPKDFEELVSEYCKKYECNENIMYALIRSESFFDSDIKSHAGAIGLCQIMETTGADIANHLKRENYSLLNPKDNVEFGCYYLNNLYTRCDNSYLQAFFSYNAGLTRVRRWLDSSMPDFEKKKNMPADLFLEALPYSETREYGRKIVSAAVAYNWIYDETDLPLDVFRDMVQELLF